jgi:hypothetical protein
MVGSCGDEGSTLAAGDVAAALKKLSSDTANVLIICSQTVEDLAAEMQLLSELTVWHPFVAKCEWIKMENCCRACAGVCSFPKARASVQVCLKELSIQNLVMYVSDPAPQLELPRARMLQETTTSCDSQCRVSSMGAVRWEAGTKAAVLNSSLIFLLWVIVIQKPSTVLL